MLLFFNKVYFKKCLVFLKRKKRKKEKPKNLELIALCLAFEVANADNDIDDLRKRSNFRKD